MKCWRLLRWAVFHGVEKEGVEDVYHSIYRSATYKAYPDQVDDVMKWVKAFAGPSDWDEAGEEDADADGDHGGSHD